MGPPGKGGGGGGDKKEQFWEAIVDQKLQAVRWGVANAGVAPATRNDDGQTSFMVACANGKDRSLAELVRWYERRLAQLRECLSQVDDDGRTCMHLACLNAGTGGAKCVAELLDAWLTVDQKDRSAGLKAKDGAGKMALQLASSSNKKAAAVIEEWLVEPETESEDEEAAADGLTSTQRSKLKKKTMQEKERKGAATGDDEDAVAAAPAASSAKCPKPTWPEVAFWVESVEKLKPIYELAVDRRSPKEGEATAVEEFAACGDIGACCVDPALWWCESLNQLKLRLPCEALNRLPDAGFARLSNLTILIMSGHSLTELPPSISKLSLKSLDVARNQLSKLPVEMPKTLEAIDVSANLLTSVAPLASCVQLVTLLVDANPKLTALELPFPDFCRLVTLSACGCGLLALDASVGDLSKLETLSLNDCPILELPPNLRECKKLKEIKVERTAIKDNKVLGYIEKGEMKMLQKYWEKNAGDAKKGGGGKKGGKKK
ncbi:hypothetical protein M885DRAFT_479049 [Pelagophyceae sp. CCMP2097]|nr:hypothetical protein M885DRAFT_479049 [Pelagophyceae sp. CCMP2097]